MTVIDASVWLRAHRSGEPLHLETGAWMDMMFKMGRRIAVPTLFLSEIGGAMARIGARQTALLAVVNEIVHNPIIVLHSVDLSPAMRSIEVVNAIGLRGCDAIYVALASELDMPLISWDNEHLTRAASLVDVMTPIQALARFSS